MSRRRTDKRRLWRFLPTASPSDGVSSRQRRLLPSAACPLPVVVFSPLCNGKCTKNSDVTYRLWRHCSRPKIMVAPFIAGLRCCPCKQRLTCEPGYVGTRDASCVPSTSSSSFSL